MLESFYQQQPHRCAALLRHALRNLGEEDMCLACLSVNHIVLDKHTFAECRATVSAKARAAGKIQWPEAESHGY